MTRFVLLLFLFLGRLAAGEIQLLNGRDLAGWELRTTPSAEIRAICQYQPDGSLAVAGQPSGYLATTTVFKNYRLHAEWRWMGKPGNSGVLVHISSGPKDRVWPLCFQIQTKNKFVGDLCRTALDSARRQNPATESFRGRQ